MSRRKWTAATVAALVLGVLAVFYSPGGAERAEARRMAPRNAGDPKIPYEKYMLDNGLEVILHRDTRAPVVYVSVWYHVGSGDEVPGRSGFAHLFEHMMFQGTKNTGEDRHFAVLQDIGASDVNGTTNNDRTNYYEQLPSNQLEAALWLESERMGYLLPAITEKSFRNQVDVVRNERRQGVDTQPESLAYLARLAAAYPEGHPYRYSVIGRHEDLEAASVDDVKTFFKTWYVPANATLLIAGDFEVDAAKAMVERWFGGFPRSEKPKRRPVATPFVAKTQRLTVDDPNTNLTSISWAWVTPAYFAPGDAELDALAHVLSNRDTGRLYRRLVIDEGLAQSVSAFQESKQRSGDFTVQVVLSPGADLSRVEAIMQEELERLMREPMRAVDLARFLTDMEASKVWGLQSLSARAEELQWCNHAFANPDCTSADLERYRAITPARLVEVATKILGQPRIEVLNRPKRGK
jgi:predicted Zn-dependent peptidase